MGIDRTAVMKLDRILISHGATNDHSLRGTIWICHMVWHLGLISDRFLSFLVQLQDLLVDLGFLVFSETYTSTSAVFIFWRKFQLLLLWCHTCLLLCAHVHVLYCELAILLQCTLPHLIVSLLQLLISKCCRSSCSYILSSWCSTTRDDEGSSSFCFTSSSSWISPWNTGNTRFES